MTKESLDIAKQVTQEFFGKLGVDGEIKIGSSQEGEVSVDVTLQEPQLLIGERGQTMFEISHILKALMRRKLGESVRLAFDINGYQKSKEQYLRELARTAADEVALFKKEKELPPMNPAERRIVHVELAERQDVVSESVGEGADRHVVVKIKAGSSGGSVPGL